MTTHPDILLGIAHRTATERADRAALRARTRAARPGPGRADARDTGSRPSLLRRLASTGTRP